MAKNTGKPSEQGFQDAYARLGKRAYLHRLVDAAEIKGRTGVVATSAASQPSDYIVVFDGITEFAEVKSTGNATSFPFSILRQTQTAAAKMILAAGGSYQIYAHCMVRQQWFKFPYSLVTATREAGKSSIKWEDLSPYQWSLAA
jgi:penicillin-binding protein-related factor A (putative recombinase)